MICQQCKREGKKSKVYVGMSTVTAMAWAPYYDEDGNLHDDDPNTTTTEYACTKGHGFQKVECKGSVEIRELPSTPEPEIVGGLVANGESGQHLTSDGVTLTWNN